MRGRRLRIAFRREKGTYPAGQFLGHGLAAALRGDDLLQSHPEVNTLKAREAALQMDLDLLEADVVNLSIYEAFDLGQNLAAVSL